MTLPSKMNAYRNLVAPVIPTILATLKEAQPQTVRTFGVEIEFVGEDASTCRAVSLPTDIFRPINNTPVVTELVPELSTTLGELVFAPIERVPGCYLLFHNAQCIALAQVQERMGPQQRWRLSSSPRSMPEYRNWSFDGTLPPLITSGNHRYYGLTCTPWEWEPGMRTTVHAPGIFLLPLDMARFVGIHVNLGTSLLTFGPAERAAIVAQAVIMALTAGTSLFNDQLTIPGFRNLAFPGCTFGFDQHGWARHAEACIGGHPKDGVDGIEGCLLAMIASDRPLFTIPPEGADGATIFRLIDKLTYNYQRLRVNPLRHEIRSPEGATRHDVTAVTAFTASAPDAVISLIGDGLALPYHICMDNIRAVHLAGMNAMISWPKNGSIVKVPVADVALQLINESARLHQTWGFSRDEIAFTHEPMRARALKRRTLSAVQTEWWNACPPGDDRIVQVASALRTWGASDTPVADWPAWSEAQ